MRSSSISSSSWKMEGILHHHHHHPHGGGGGSILTRRAVVVVALLEEEEPKIDISISSLLEYMDLGFL
jgi:hypothetical protein